MEEIGIVKKTMGAKAKIAIQRHAACGDCGACQVGKDKMTMNTVVQNPVGAKVGDTVAVEMTFGNVMKAGSIAYGIPLIAFLIGAVLGYYCLPKFFAVDAAIAGFGLGLLLVIISYLVITVLDRKGVFGKAYEPTVTKILEEN